MERCHMWRNESIFGLHFIDWNNSQTQSYRLLEYRCTHWHSLFPTRRPLKRQISFDFEILRFSDCHSLVEDDRLRQIRPFAEKVTDICQNVYRPDRSVCVDEILVLYKGRLVWKQYMKTKRSRFGMKLFALCSSKGYTWNFSIYSGHESYALHLLCTLLGQNYHMFVDNWNMSSKLDYIF